MTKSVSYFSDYNTQRYTCECGWNGAADDLASELFDELVELSCPKCDRHLLLVSYPTGDETKAAAATGNAKAVAMLDDVHERERRAAKRERTELRSPSQLPDVAGDALQFVWDLEKTDDNSYYVISLGDRLVWRELAAWEDWERFEVVKGLLKQRYGLRFRSVTPTDAARFNLLGDNISATLAPTCDLPVDRQ